jgi:hypothetical protein
LRVFVILNLGLDFARSASLNSGKNTAKIRKGLERLYKSVISAIAEVDERLV